MTVVTDCVGKELESYVTHDGQVISKWGMGS